MLLPVLVLCCARATKGPPISFVVDLRHPGAGTIPVEMQVMAPGAGRSLALSTFIQPEALRLDTIRAHQGGRPLAVEKTRDERGFARFVVATSPRAGPMVVRYAVRPGATEEVAMSGLSGYRFGYLDRDFGLFGGRQLFLLPMDSGSPTRIQVRFLLPPKWTLATPWRDQRQETGRARPGSSPDSTMSFELLGRDAAARLVEATLGAGIFDTASAGDFRVQVLRSLPDGLRGDALRRALALEQHLVSLLGRPPGAYELVLVPKSPDGMLISVAPGPNSFGLSLGEGLPTRWLSIGRAIGRAYVEARAEGAHVPETRRWVLEALPIYLGSGFSEREAWRSRQAWLELFYYDAAGLAFDLRKPGDLGDAPEALMREWRGTLVLHLLSQELVRLGRGGLEDRLRSSAAQGRRLDPVGLIDQDLPDSSRAKLDRWLTPAAYPFPFPGTSQDDPQLRLRVPPALAARSSRSEERGGRRLDLYFGGRNFGLLEQCGCRSRQAGGLARRATLLRARLRDATPFMALELGDAIPFDQEAFSLDRQKLAESDLAFELLAGAGEVASVVSHAELSYGPGFLAERLARLPHGFRLLSANVSAPGLTLASYLEKNLGVGVRVIGVEDPAAYHLGRALEFEDAIAGVRIEDPAAAVQRNLDSHRLPALTVIAGSLSPTTVLDLHRRVPDVSVIVTNDYFRFTQDPRFVFERPLGSSLATFGMLGRTLVVLLRTDAYALARVGLGLDRRGGVAAAEIEDLVLDETIADDPRIRKRLDAHYEHLARESGLAEPAPIGTQLGATLEASYAGDTACSSCHRSETEQWQATPHASAYATLLAKRRQGVPGCFACHVTGYRQPTGYRTIADHALRNVQCESCHGPGSRHIRDPRRENIVRVPAFNVCAECHDDKHSEMNDANFADYRARVVHTARPAMRSTR